MPRNLILVPCKKDGTADKRFNGYSTVAANKVSNNIKEVIVKTSSKKITYK